MNSPLLPGSRIGVAGAGQLGRMMAIAARQMGYVVHVLTNTDDAPAEQVADHVTCGHFSDLDLWREFARQVDVVTYETESLPLDGMLAVAEIVPVRPGMELLRLSQHRMREKSWLRDHGLPVPEFFPVATRQQFQHALDEFAQHGVLKTTAGGYDGKGQWLMRQPADVVAAWNDVGPQLIDEHPHPDRHRSLSHSHAQAAGTPPVVPPPLDAPFILERLVDYQLEFSVIGARSAAGEFATYGPMLNVHQNHILDLSVCPAGIPERAAVDSRAMVRAIAEQLDVVGLFCVEFFLTRDDDVLINEIAPRPHNSGHLTIEAHVVSQFEQQVRTVCGLPLGSTRQLSPAAMVNLLGDLWLTGPLAWDAALPPQGHLHLYGKRTALAGRKMGHLTVLAESADEARTAALASRHALTFRTAVRNS
ncbi:MAG: 5-(carboxyamino)imidazole ribonucleotide synthase [Pirellulales bacterium]